jgi:hypothetical protein
MSKPMISDADLLHRINAFCERHAIKPTAFGRLALGDGSLISNLKAGRSPTLRSATKIDAFMSSYRSPTPHQAEAA